MSWQDHKTQKEMARRMSEDMHVRRSMVALTQNAQTMQKLHNKYASEAVAAERAHNHPQAVRLAAAAGKARQYQQLNDDMRGKIEMANTVRTTNQAMADAASATTSALRTLTRAASSANPVALATNTAMLEAQMEGLMAQTSDLFSLTDTDTCVDAESEAYLNSLMAAQPEKPTRLLQNTTDRLEKLTRNRMTLNEGSK